MNAIKKNFRALIICTIAVFAMSAMPPVMKVSKADDNAFLLSVDNYSGAKAVRVTLKDADGDILEKDRIAKNELFSKEYQFDFLPVGEYKLLVEDGARTTSQVIIVNEEGIKAPKHLKATYFAPAIVLNDDKLDFTMLCLHETLVGIEIRDAEGRVNYSEATCEKGSVQRRFNLSDLEPGEYTITTSIEGQKFESVYRKAFMVPGSIAGF
jgi:hypothetical protein